MQLGTDNDDSKNKTTQTSKWSNMPCFLKGILQDLALSFVLVENL